MPVGWATSALTVAAEFARNSDYVNWGDFCDVVKLLVYCFWSRLAWRCSRNVDNWGWMPISRFALGAGLLWVVMG